MTGGQDGALDERLAALGAAVAGLVGVDWGAAGGGALESAAVLVEQAARRLHAVGCEVAAEVARRDEAKGRSTGSAATRLGAALRVSTGEARRRIEAGRRAGSDAMTAHAQGRITASQERAVARWVSELPDGAPEEARVSFAAHLTALAEEGLGSRSIGVAAERELARVDPTWQDRREERQATRRAARLHEPDADGNALLSIVCDKPMQALVDAVLARFGGPGQCVAAPVDPETGQAPDVTELVANDRRTPEQRAHDALRHVLQLGLEAGPGARRGVASIVVRVTPEQLDEIDAGRSGGITVADTGTSMSARQAVALSEGRSWFVSALRDGREHLRRIDVDRNPRNRLATTIQRLVLYAAHGGCIHPGCTQAAARCQAHHVHEHRKGGPTTVANLALVCPTHHGWIGDGPDQWRTVPDPAHPGRPRWIPPGDDRADRREAA